MGTEKFIQTFHLYRILKEDKSLQQESCRNTEYEFSVCNVIVIVTFY